MRLENSLTLEEDKRIRERIAELGLEKGRLYLEAYADAVVYMTRTTAKRRMEVLGYKRNI